MSKNLTIFDLDNTLIKGDSSTVWSRFLVREGRGMPIVVTAS